MSAAFLKEAQPTQSERRWARKVTKFFKGISLESYRTPLYYQHRDGYSSVCGGITSLIAFFGVITYCFVIMVGIFNKNHWELDQHSKELGGLEKKLGSHWQPYLYRVPGTNHQRFSGHYL
jgi:hypothetical protein